MLKEWIDRGELVIAPGVYDGFSALLAQAMPFRAIYLSGYTVAAARHALPDAGLVGLREMLDAIALVRAACDKPLIADGDTGYGGLLNVKHAVRSYEAAGVAAVQLEDQEMPKKCGHTRGKRVVSADEMVAKVEVAVEARRSDDFLIVARTDTRQSFGIDEALERCRRYRDAGADVVFVDAPQSRDEVRRIGSELDGPKFLNMTPQKGFVTPDLSVDEIRDLGFSIAIYPGLFAQASVAAMESAAEHFLEKGRMDASLAPRRNVHELVGFGEVWDDEERWQKKYGITPGPVA